MDVTLPPSDDLIALVAKHSGFAQAVHADARLRDNLGFRIGRAKRLFRAFAKRYDVDLRTLNLARYFDGIEAQVRFPEFAYWLKALHPAVRRAWQEAPARPDISVRHLALVARDKRWTDPPAATYEPSQPILPPLLRAAAAAAGFALRLPGLALVALLGSVVALSLWRLGAALAAGNPMAALGHGTAAAAYGAVIAILGFGVTQQRFRSRFGMHWDFRRNRLREIDYEMWPNWT